MIEDFEIESLIEQNDRFVSYSAYFNKSGRKCIIRRYLIDESTGLGDVFGWEKEFKDLLTKFMRIDHPSLRTIIGGGFDERDGSPYVVYERLHANSLSKLLNLTQEYNSSHAIAMTQSILEGLSFLNSREIIHGNISPEVIQFTDVRDKNQWVLDWCPISSIRCKHNIERFRMDIYLAPEVLDGAHPSHNSDLFSLGKATERFYGDQDIPKEVKNWISQQTDIAPEKRYQDAYSSFQGLSQDDAQEQIVVQEAPTVKKEEGKKEASTPKITNNIVTSNKQLVPEHSSTPEPPARKLSPVEILKRTLKVRLKAYK